MRAANGVWLGCYEPPDPRCEACGGRDCACSFCETCREWFEEAHEHCAGCEERKESCGCMGDAA